MTDNSAARLLDANIDMIELRLVLEFEKLMAHRVRELCSGKRCNNLEQCLCAAWVISEMDKSPARCDHDGTLLSDCKGQACKSHGRCCWQ